MIPANKGGMNELALESEFVLRDVNEHHALFPFISEKKPHLANAKVASFCKWIL